MTFVFPVSCLQNPHCFTLKIGPHPVCSQMYVLAFSGVCQLTWSYLWTFAGRRILVREWSLKKYHWHVLLIQYLFTENKNPKFVSNRFEAAYLGIPVICIPFFLDQFSNCKVLTSTLKMGVLLKPEDISKETLEAAIFDVVNNPQYFAQAKKVQSMLRDKPMKPQDLFLYWVNYTIRYQGAKHLVATAPFELNIFQYLCLDVVLCIVAIAGTLLLVMIKIAWLACHSWFRSQTETKKNK